jgi:hypothetical protein
MHLRGRQAALTGDVNLQLAGAARSMPRAASAAEHVRKLLDGSDPIANEQHKAKPTRAKVSVIITGKL